MLDPLMPINPGCNSQTPADRFTSIVDSFWLQEPQKPSLLEPKTPQETQHLFQPVIVSVDCQQLVKKPGRGWEMTRWATAIAMHGRCWLTRQLKASTMFVNLRGHDWFTGADRKQDLCSTNQYAVRLLPLWSAETGTSLYQSNMTLMCFYSSLTQPVMNLLAGREGDGERQAALD